MNFSIGREIVDSLLGKTGFQPIVLRQREENDE